MRARQRERDSDGVLGRARQLRMPKMAAQVGLQLRVSWGREKREDERERRSVTERYALRSSAPTREERERERLVEPTDRPTDRLSLAWVADLVFFRVL